METDINLQNQWLAKTLQSPREWAQAFLRDPNDPTLPLDLRAYQAEALDNSRNNQRTVLRWGRRTGKSVVLCADTLYHAAVMPLVAMIEEGKDRPIPLKILVLTPMDSQIKMLFDTMLSLCADSPFLEGLITKVRRSDVSEIHFSNGSVIKGMTIGVSSGSKGTSIRGMSADYMLIDEMDFIPRAIWEQVVLPIANTNTKCRVRVSSTPSGERNHFYEYCTRNLELGWYHLHVPSWHADNPSWISIEKSKELGLPLYASTEYQFRSTMTNDAYDREFGANFGDSSAGVYKKDLIDSTMVQYCNEYDARDPDIFNPGFTQNPNNIYIIGVDWNTYHNGGQVVMVEYCKESTISSYIDKNNAQLVTIDFTGKFRLFYRKGIKAKDSTQRETRTEILRLMELYKVDALFVDYGAGDTNVEELTFYGKQRPHLEMEHKLNVVDFGANIEHYDPVLRQVIKKRAKSVIINTSVHALEENKVLLPKEEDSKHRLVDQMRGYKVKNTTSRGDFTYEGEDHVLDAYHLAIYGFYKMFSYILNTQYETKIRFMDNPIMDNAPHRSCITTPILQTETKYQDPEKQSSRFGTFKSPSRRSNLGTFNRRSTF